jgi:hypothetical protein
MIQRDTLVNKLKFILKIPDSITKAVAEVITARARETLADTVEPFRWSQEQLNSFVASGISDLKNIRSDVEELGYAPDAFTSALANYTVYRALALDNDAQNNNGALSDKFFALFKQQSEEVKFFFTDSQLEDFSDQSAIDLVSLRPELRIAGDGTLKAQIKTTSENMVSYDIPERFTDAIAFGAAFIAAVHSKNDTANYFREQFQGALQIV